MYEVFLTLYDLVNFDNLIDNKTYESIFSAFLVTVPDKGCSRNTPCQLN